MQKTTRLRNASRKLTAASVTLTWLTALSSPACRSSSSSGSSASSSSPVSPADAGEARTVATETDAGADSAQTPAEVAVKALVVAWSRALDAHDLAALSSLYAPRVRFYRRDVPRAAVLSVKQRALGSGSTFRQEITSDIDVALGADGVYYASFVKRSGAMQLSDVHARIGAMRGDGGVFQIIEETDAPTIDGARLTRRDECYATAERVVRSLPAVAKILADTQKEIDAHYKDRALGGVGPINSEDGMSAGFGVHTSERYEALVWYSVTPQGALSVSVLGEDLVVPASEAARVASACRQLDGGN